jgi:hypothetical protein
MTSVILYGFGTPTAYVYSTLQDKSAAQALLERLRLTWAKNSDKWSLHAFKDVVQEDVDDEYVLCEFVKQPQDHGLLQPKGPQNGKMGKNRRR